MGGGGVILLVAALVAGAQSLCPDDLLPKACGCEKINSTQRFSITCDFTNQKEQDFHLRRNMLPNTTFVLFVTGAFHMTIYEHAFADLKDFHKLELKSIRNLTISSLSLENLYTNHLYLNIFDCDNVLIETDSFRAIGGGITANIFYCGYVQLENKSFIRVMMVKISHVPRLHLYGKVFQNTVALPRSNISINKVLFENVTVSTIEKGCFGIGIRSVFINNSNVTTLSSNTFNSPELFEFIINNSEIATIEVEALAPDKHFKNLTFFNCTIKNIKSGAIKAGIDSLTLSHSTIENIKNEGISSQVGIVSITDNKFVKIENNGLDLKNWNILLMERNFFEDMSSIIIEPFNIIDSSLPDTNYFNFVNNYMENISFGALHSIYDILKSGLIKTNYSYNYFNHICSCDIGEWLKTIMVDQSDYDYASLSRTYEENSFCIMHRKCDSYLVQGHMQISRYMDIYCDENKNVSCIDAKNSVIKKITNIRYQYNFPPLVGNEKFSKEVASRLFLWLLLLTTVILIVLVILILICMKIRQKSQCTNMKNEITSCFSRFDRMFGVNDGIDSASISRVSINDYNENHMLQETTLNEDDRILPNGNSLEELFDTSDKATQTLPEELTKELLESLREKLDDPENYSEARETIEHLYDLIKVEEYCNLNNNNSTRRRYNTDAGSIENMYDVIQQPLIHQGRNKKNMVSVGTKVPSLEKLSQTAPYSKLCNEYFEPRDRTVHLYSELTPNKNIPCDKKSDAMNFLRVIETNMNPNRNNVSPVAMAGPSGLNLKSGTQRSNKSSRSAVSDGSSNMANRPLPEKPRDPS